MKPLVYSEKHRMTYYETDSMGRSLLSMLLDLIVLVSEDQSNALKIGPHLTQAMHVGWVVIQYSVRINRLPVNEQDIELSTRSSSCNRFLAYREFWIKDQSGKTLVYVRSQWILMNLLNRQLSPIPQKLIRPYGAKEVGMIPHLTRPKLIDLTGRVRKKTYRVRYSDIDINRHVNNSRYLEWMCDTLSIQFLKKYSPKGIDLRFKNEVDYGHCVISKVQIIPDHGRIITRHEIWSQNHLSAVANLTWWKKN